MLALRLLWLRRLSLLCVGMTILLMTLGAWVKANGAGLACPDWPQCYGEWMPPFPSQENGGTYGGQAVTFTQAQVLYEWTHRAVVSLLLIPLGALAFVAMRSPEANPVVRRLSSTGFGLYFAQAGLGAVTVVTGNPPWATTAHLVLATLFLTTLVVAATVARIKPLGEPKPAPIEAPKPRQVAFVYRDDSAAGAATVEPEAQNG
ncbi:MAG TPA: COX15/CtaA family protein [Candidatus Thermoplasmatota archaeon]|nr:COX15/CtaA family protein [Candidatus Thermoplasmatota archaeon]